MEWRPKEGWDAVEIGHKAMPFDYYPDMVIETFVKAGADALLTALVNEAKGKKIWFGVADDGHILINVAD